tara:strand:+ start:908 stop:1369 length:462 start_codon:yes stop_codon:yes gene_type:complete
MGNKCSKVDFIQTLERNEGKKDNHEMAVGLGISDATFYRMKKRHSDAIADHAKQMARECATEMVGILKRNARGKASGSTASAVKLLEIAQVYTPAIKNEHLGNERPAGVILLPVKKPVGAPVDYDVQELSLDKKLSGVVVKANDADADDREGK